MVQYVQRKVTLSKGQAEKLAKGKKVRLTHKALSGGAQTVYLTGQQNRKVETRLKRGTGADIGPFEQAQINHNVQHGSGFFDSFKAAAKGALKDLAKEGLKLAVDKGGDFLKNKATEMIEKKLGTPAAGEAAVSGSGVKRRNDLTKKQMDMIRLQHGEGFFDDVLTGLKTVAKVALPMAGNAFLASRGMPPMFGGGKRGRGGKHGGAIGIYRRTARGAGKQVGRSFRLP